MMLLMTLVLPITSANPTCEGSRQEFIEARNAENPSLKALTAAFAGVVATCGIDASHQYTDTSCSGEVDQLDECVSELTDDVGADCAGVANMRTGFLPAAFEVTFVGVGQPLTLPDLGSARVAIVGGSQNEPIFDGNGIYSGLLAGGAFKFPKAAGVLLPGDEGDANAHCIALALVGGDGYAQITAGGITYHVYGETLR